MRVRAIVGLALGLRLCAAAVPADGAVIHVVWNDTELAQALSVSVTYGASNTIQMSVSLATGWTNVAVFSSFAAATNRFTNYTSTATGVYFRVLSR